MAASRVYFQLEDAVCLPVATEAESLSMLHMRANTRLLIEFLVLLYECNQSASGRTSDVEKRK